MAAMSPLRLQRVREHRGPTRLLIAVVTISLAAFAPIAVVLAKGAGETAVAVAFAAIALTLHVWLWRRALLHIAPRVAVTVGGPARLGTPLDLAIRVRSVMPMRHVRARLIGREESTHTVGTHTITDTAAFFEDVIEERTGAGRVAALEGRVKLKPKRAVPTLHAAHNRIRWVIAVDADVVLWPDPQLEYELEVGPPEVRRE